MTSSWSVIGDFESSTTIAVISFEIDAIGTTACEFLSNSGSPEFWSTTYATLERSASASGVSCRPNAWPTVGRRGWNATLRTAPRWPPCTLFAASVTRFRDAFARGASAAATLADLSGVALADFFFADEAGATAFFLAAWVFAVAAKASAGVTDAVVASNATATDTAVPSVMLCNNLRGENDSAFIGVWTKRAGGFRKCS